MHYVIGLCVLVSLYAIFGQSGKSADSPKQASTASATVEVPASFNPQSGAPKAQTQAERYAAFDEPMRKNRPQLIPLEMVGLWQRDGEGNTVIEIGGTGTQVTYKRPFERRCFSRRSQSQLQNLGEDRYLQLRSNEPARLHYTLIDNNTLSIELILKRSKKPVKIFTPYDEREFRTKKCN